jgi:hypothetical protein
VARFAGLLVALCAFAACKPAEPVSQQARTLPRRPHDRDSAQLNLAAGCYSVSEIPLQGSAKSLFKLPERIELLSDSVTRSLEANRKPNELIWNQGRLIRAAPGDQSRVYEFAQGVWWHRNRDSLELLSANCCSGIGFALHRAGGGWTGVGRGYYDVPGRVDSESLRLDSEPCHIGLTRR